jgi:predicted helicase
MPAKHTHATSLVSARIFDSLQEFSDLEAKIEALSQTNTKAQGDAFEIFAEAYFNCQKIFQVVDHWPVGQVPLEIRVALNLPSDQKGIDGVIKNQAGESIPYQVKFRSGRSKLGYSEVASFLGVTEEARTRVLFTNANEIAKDIAVRRGLIVICGYKLDQLSQKEINDISNWIFNKPVAHEPLKIAAHQRKAVSDVIEHLKEQSRAQLIMACGTGKTLVGQRVSEAINANSVVILVPTLTLVGQTLNSWITNTRLADSFDFFTVCSDLGRVDGFDDLIGDKSEFPFYISTTPGELREFLRRPSKRAKIVFCTYQSSHTLIEGSEGFQFDFGIFDEAHRIVGPKAKRFNLALSEENIRIRKRLFMTATPRVISMPNSSVKSQTEILGMNNVDLFGVKAHVLSFRKAVDEGLICPIKLLVAVITDDEISVDRLNRSKTLGNGIEFDSKWVALKIAVTKAINLVNAKKVITFHSRVKTAKQFSDSSEIGIGSELTGFKIAHVNGSQPGFQRSEMLRIFTEAERSLITNAQCLTEGIDIPAVDLIVFSDPKYSKVAITQALGRAMRKPKDQREKSVGYVLVPIYSKSLADSDLHEAAFREQFDTVMRVAISILEHSDSLTEESGAVKSTKTKRVFSLSQLGPSLEILTHSLELRKLIEGIKIEALPESAPALSWDQGYKLLLEFQRTYGDVRVPPTFRTIAGRDLGKWVLSVRKQLDKLSPIQIEKLEALKGWYWDMRDRKVDDWNRAFQALNAFHKEHGTTKIPSDFHDPTTNFKLATWVAGQRRSRKVLNSQQRKKLESFHDWFWRD